MFKPPLLVATIFFCTVGCTEVVDGPSSGRFGNDVSRSTWSGSGSSGPLPGGEDRSSLTRGTDEFINRGALGGRASQSAVVDVVNDRQVEISLINASIPAAAQAVLGDALGLRYTVSPQVSGTVTVQSTGAIPKSVLLKLFETALDANNARLERKGETIQIVPGSSGNRVFRGAGATNLNSGSIIVAPLEFVSAKQMVGLLSPLIEEGLTAIPDKDRNLLMLSGKRGQLEAAIDALNLFDVDVMKGKSVALVQLEAADPEDVVEELNTIFEAQEGGMLEGVIEFQPNSRLNSVLVITSRAKYLSRAQRWIRELDTKASNTRRYTRVYPLHNRKPTEIAPILDGFLGNSSEAAGSDREGQSGGTTTRSHVAADIERNALVVRALRAEHEELKRLLRDLDKRGRQVALEATIAEVTLKDDVSLGVRWFFESGSAKTTFSDVASGAVSSNFPGFSSVFSLANADIVLNALATVTDVEVISSPTLVVLDNKEAVLQIGDQVPVATQTSTSSTDANAPVVTTVQYRDTGVILTVKPQIGASGELTLEVSQEVSSVSSTVSSGIDSPTISQRQISTTVILHDGATLALGGLVQETDNEVVRKVPGLGDIPAVGNIFRSKRLESARTELLILIRPRIIESREDATRVTSSWRQRLAKSNSILSSGLGTPKHSVPHLLH